MAKRTLYPLYAAEDEQAVRPVLDGLRAKGFAIAPQSGIPKKKDAVLFFLSKNMTEQSQAVDDFLRMDTQGAYSIPINLDGSTPPALIENAILARNTIYAERYSTAELAARIADALKTPSVLQPRLARWLIVAAAAALLAMTVFVLIRIFGGRGIQQTSAEATPEPTATPFIDPQANIKPEELERIYELIILGDKLCYTNGNEEWVSEKGWARVGAEYYGMRVENEDGVHWYSNEDGHEIETAHWDDLGFLRYMKRLKLLTIVCVEGALPDLSNLENLDNVEIYDSEITDISGLRGTKIINFGYRGNTLFDFSPLDDCPLLTSAHLEMEAPMPQDLTSFGPPTLQSLRVWGSWEDGTIDFGGLKRCKNLKVVILNGVPLKDLSCLSEASALESLEVILPQLENLNGLQSKPKLTYFRADGACENLTDLKALSDSTSLEEVDLHCGNMNGDLSWLANAKNLKQLILWEAHSVRSLQGLEDHFELERLQIFHAERLIDIAALASCTNLKSIDFNATYALSDISPIVKLPNLRSLEIYGSQLDDVDFLNDIVNKNDFSFGIAEVHDWSGLAAIPSFSYLNVTDRNGSCLKYLTGKTVRRLELWNRSGRNGWNRDPLNLSQFPNVTEEYILHGITSLEGLPASSAFRVSIDEAQYLTSLEGLGNLPHFAEGDDGDLDIEGCPRLTDWSALDGMHLAALRLSGTYSLPQFRNFEAAYIMLNHPVALSDLRCFEGFAPDGDCSIELNGIDEVQDIAPLYGVKHGDVLLVPAHLGEQAKLLVESGNFRDFEITYPNERWNPADIQVTLLSLDELETLPRAVLGMVDRLCMAGDRIYDPDAYWVKENWDGNALTAMLCRNGEEEGEPIAFGTALTDLSVLKDLTGLRELKLYNQSFETLEGVQYLESLEVLECKGCATLTDASAAFTLQTLRELNLQGTAVTSIAGVQNLYNLERLDLDGLSIDDLSPLGECSEQLDVSVSLQLMPFADFCNLPANVRNRFRAVCFSGSYVHDPYAQWQTDDEWDGGRSVPVLRNADTGERIYPQEGVVTDLSVLPEMAELQKLYLFAQPLSSLAGVETFAHLETIRLQMCSNVTDLSPLFDMQTLHEIGADGCGVTSIAGIENLKELTELDIGHCLLTDLSPLAKIDYSYCMQPDADGRELLFSLRVDGLFETLSPEQYLYLGAVPAYDCLNVWNTHVALWLDAIDPVQIRILEAGNCNMQNDDIRAIAERHPELTELILSWNSQRLTDLTPLLTMPNLRYVRISSDLSEAIASLGENLTFELVTE